MTKDTDHQTLPQDVSPEDSLEDSSRRALLGKIARAGAAAVPVSLILLDEAKANVVEGSPGGGGGGFGT